MRRLIPFLTCLACFSTQVLAQQYFVQGNRPYIILPSESDGSDPQHFSSDYSQSSEITRRSGVSPSTSEEDSKETVQEDAPKKTLRPKLPPNFTEEVNKNRRFPPRPAVQLKADPASIEEDDEEEEEVAARGMSRFLWPFSVSISKGKGDHGSGHGSHQYYNHYPKKGTRQHNSKKKYDVLTDQFQGLTEHDYQILKSKGYKKYQKKKKKKIKKLKKKLKLKRVLQKILEKKISYLDGLTSEYY